MRLTGGVISYSERRTIAQYEHKDCKIELAFAFPEGDAGVPAFLDTIQAEIRARCLDMLGLAKPAVASKPWPKTEAPSIADAIPSVEPAPKKVRAPKAKVVAPIEDDAPPADEPKAAAVKAPEVEPADDFDSFDEPEVAKITDAQLITAATKASAKVGMGVARKALEEFTDKRPANCSSVPADKRAECLAKLEALAK